MTEAEERLRQKLAARKTERSQAIADADAAIALKAAATATAGSEFDDQIAAAQDDFTAAQSAYDDFLNQTTQTLSDAQNSIDAIDTTPANGGTFTPITITTGDTPDCSAAAIQAAFNPAFVAVYTILDELLGKVNGGNTQNIKDAMSKLKAVGQSFRDQMPGSNDNEALKASALAALDGLW